MSSMTFYLSVGRDRSSQPWRYIHNLQLPGVEGQMWDLCIPIVSFRLGPSVLHKKPASEREDDCVSLAPTLEVLGVHSVNPLEQATRGCSVSTLETTGDND